LAARQGFKEDTALARRKQRVTFQAGNLCSRGASILTILYSASQRGQLKMIVSDLLIVKAG